MDFLDNLVLPQSAEHIELLHYMLILLLALFVPFISIIFGGTFASIHYGKKFRKTKTLYYKKFSKDVIEYVTVNNGVGVIFRNCSTYCSNINICTTITYCTKYKQ